MDESMPFCKVYNHPEIGQILIALSMVGPKEDDLGPMPIMKLTIQPAGLSMFSEVYKFPRSQDGQDERNMLFESITEEVGVGMAVETFKTLKTLSQQD
jgi:hypothetical protein